MLKLYNVQYPDICGVWYNARFNLGREIPTVGYSLCTWKSTVWYPCVMIILKAELRCRHQNICYLLIWRYLFISYTELSVLSWTNNTTTVVQESNPCLKCESQKTNQCTVAQCRLHLHYSKRYVWLLARFKWLKTMKIT
jgi:hypothetical protein